MTTNFHHIKNLNVSSSIKILLVVLFPLISILSCGSSSSEGTDEEASASSRYPDGKYCADVDYYNPSSGTRKSYTLNVEVEDNEVTKIYFGNGGYLDNSHISPESLSSSGRCSITDDKNRQFDIDITGSACSFIDNILDDESGTGELLLTLEQCAATIPMTEDELLEYEKDFSRSRFDKITESRCSEIFDYILKYREHKKKKAEMDRQVNEGYIQTLKSVGKEDYISCQTMIVKRYGHFYLVEVAGPRRAMMGLTSFNPSTSSWQEIYIKESFDKPMYLYEARVIDQASSMAALEFQMDNYCSSF